MLGPGGEDAFTKGQLVFDVVNSNTKHTTSCCSRDHLSLIGMQKGLISHVHPLLTSKHLGTWSASHLLHLMSVVVIDIGTLNARWNNSRRKNHGPKEMVKWECFFFLYFSLLFMGNMMSFDGLRYWRREQLMCPCFVIRQGGSRMDCKVAMPC